MKKNVRFLALLMSMTVLLTGCQSGNSTQNVSETGTREVVTEQDATEQNDVKQEEAESAVNDALVEQIKMKYAGTETVAYQEPMYQLPKDYKFVFENVSTDVFSGDVYSDIKVFSDSELTGYVDITIEEDYDNNQIIVEPCIMFNIDDEEGSTSVNDGTWGSRSKFYLVQYRNLETNELYEKPMVTVFTIARELDTPTVKQSVSVDGYYQLTWEPIVGAESYEVYSFDSGMEYADHLVTTDKTNVNSSEFYGYWSDSKEVEAGVDEEEELDEWDDIVDDYDWSMNTNLDVEAEYFVVARNSNGDVSGMSNLCKIADIANTIPVIQELGVETSYEDTTALVLPTHTNIEMLDGTLARVLIDYRNSEIIATSDTSYQLIVKAKNLPIEIQPLYFFGMEEDAFMADMEKVMERQDGLETKSVTQESNIDIPFVPSQEEVAESNETPEAKDTEDFEETEEIEEETETSEDETSEDLDLNAQLENYLYANTSLSAWIGMNLLLHEEEICMDGFAEASDSEYLISAFQEAQQQNPLIDVIEDLSYDYKSNSLRVTYVHTAEETREKQIASIEKANEIADSIITEDMSDFEKEEAINRYLCENSSYNESIFDYINEDGSISNDVLDEHGDSFLPYGILVENVGVCESYSEAFWMIAKNAGLDVIIETGRLDGVNHEWNRVKIDGSWCVMDVTNNDNEYIPNCYFNLSDETSDGILIPGYTSVLPGYYYEYEALDNDKEYYYQMGKVAGDQDEAVAMLSDELAIDTKAAVRMADEMDEAEIEEIIGGVVREAQLTSGMYYFNEGVLSIIAE